MKTTKRIESNVEDFQFGFIPPDEDEFVEIGPVDLEKVAKKLGCSADLLELIMSNFETLKLLIHDDLADIWEEVE